MTDILSKEEKEKMFAEHIDKLTQKKRTKFRFVCYALEIVMLSN